MYLSFGRLGPFSFHCTNLSTGPSASVSCQLLRKNFCLSVDRLHITLCRLHRPRETKIDPATRQLESDGIQQRTTQSFDSPMALTAIGAQEVELDVVQSVLLHNRCVLYQRGSMDVFLVGFRVLD